MLYLKKAHAGGDSYGHVWVHDGDVVEVTDEQAQVLLRVPASDFTVVSGPDTPPPAPEGVDEISEAPMVRRGRPPKQKPEDTIVE